MNRRNLTVATLFTVAGIASLAVASPAFAHIDPDPTDAQAGSEVSVGFTVQHGCDGSPTIQLDMRLPDGVTNANPEPPDGWIGTVDDNVVTFEGGPLADDTELTFRVGMVLPPTPDTTIYFPFVQRCEVGEIRWIDIPSAGSGAELDEPAPAMQLFGPVGTTIPTPTTTIAPTTTPAPTTTSATASTVGPPATTSDATAPVSTESAAPSVTAPPPENGNGAGTLVFVLAIAAVGLIAAIVVVSARRKRP
jgi:uncharacterized protein YcnI